jgi:hypothetical protein
MGIKMMNRQITEKVIPSMVDILLERQKRVGSTYPYLVNDKLNELFNKN